MSKSFSIPKDGETLIGVGIDNADQEEDQSAWLDHIQHHYNKATNLSKVSSWNLIMNYYENKDLHSFIRRKKGENQFHQVFDILTQISISLGISKALEHLHERNIVHFDPKPQNIMLDSSLVPKLGDFALAQSVNDLNVNISVLGGTDRFMPPEVLLKKEGCSKVDVYVFSMVLRLIFSSLLPFEDEYTVNCFKTIVGRYGTRPNLLRNIEVMPEEIVSLIQDCWAQDENNRPDFKTITSQLELFQEGNIEEKAIEDQLTNNNEEMKEVEILIMDKYKEEELSQSIQDTKNHEEEQESHEEEQESHGEEQKGHEEEQESHEEEQKSHEEEQESHEEEQKSHGEEQKSHEEEEEWEVVVTQQFQNSQEKEEEMEEWDFVDDIK